MSVNDEADRSPEDSGQQSIPVVLDQSVLVFPSHSHLPFHAHHSLHSAFLSILLLFESLPTPIDSCSRCCCIVSKFSLRVPLAKSSRNCVNVGCLIV